MDLIHIFVGVGVLVKPVSHGTSTEGTSTDVAVSWQNQMLRLYHCKLLEFNQTLKLKGSAIKKVKKSFNNSLGKNVPIQATCQSRRFP